MATRRTRKGTGRKAAGKRNPGAGRAAPDTGKVWSGRFGKKTARLMEEFSRSVDIDRLMWREELAVTRAWAGALRQAGVLTLAEDRRLGKALRAIEQEFGREQFRFLEADEDIHVAVERRLTELAGEAGRKIHAGRSRNDQVVTDLRLFLKRKLDEIAAGTALVVEAAVQQAEATIDLIVPAYTHNQPAQPIRMAHYLLSLFWAMARHHQQLMQARARLDECPLGSGAVAGTALPVDRKALARELGFARVSPNAVDATGHRGFVGEVAFVCADICITLSRYCADFVVWCSPELSLMEPGEEYATGSSMMPNKKNPDAFELVRGKAARVQGALATLLTLQKGLPVTYVRDLQEDKPPVFEAVETTIQSARVFAAALAASRFRQVDRLDPGLFATDLADHLTRQGLPFRESHRLVASAIRAAQGKAFTVEQLPPEVRERLVEGGAGLERFFRPEASVERRRQAGGTSRASVKAQLRQARSWLARHSGSP